MPSIYDLKPKFQALLRPSAGFFASHGITANQITILALVLSLVAGAVVGIFSSTRYILLLVPAVLFVRMALNAIDGMLAREHGMKSSLGAVLNELGDVASDAGLYLPLAFVPGIPAPLLTLVVTLGIIGEMAGVVGVQIGADRRYDGPMGKSDRAAAIGVVCFLLGCGLAPGTWLTIAFAAMAVLSGLTIINRSRQALRIVADQKQQRTSKEAIGSTDRARFLPEGPR